MVLHSALWRRLDLPDGLVHGALSELEPDAAHPDGGFLLDGAAVVRDEDGTWSTRHSVVTDRRWQTRSVFVEVLAGDGLERVELSADPLGNWTLDGRDWPELQGCTDVDVSTTPLTNLLPVLRLGLEPGGEAAIDVAWLDLPSLAVHRVRQTYRRLEDLAGPDGLERYTYADTDFGPFDITVDRAGFVVAYQGLFARVG